jgi:hypothetical protein
LLPVCGKIHGLRAGLNHPIITAVLCHTLLIGSFTITLIALKKAVELLID